MLCVLRNSSKFIKTIQNAGRCREAIAGKIRHSSALISKSEDVEERERAVQSSETKPESSSLALDFPPREAHVPSFNLAGYVNDSMTLQQMLKLGVDLHQLERRKGIGQFVLGLDFDQNVKPYLTFLADQGVSPDDFGKMITKNPLLFKEDLDDLNTRVKYLESKQFSKEARQLIFTKNPYWLMFSTRRIDRRLGYFQKQLYLSGDNLRLLATKNPRIITYKMDNLRESLFCMREEMGFDREELRSLILAKPRLMMIPPDQLIERFSYAHNDMKISHAQLLQCPGLLASREFRLRERHEFLKLLGRAQYDPHKDLYIPPASIVEGNNFQFARNVAKSDLQTFDLFLKNR